MLSKGILRFPGFHGLVPKFGLRVSKSGPWGLKFVPYIPKFDGAGWFGSDVYKWFSNPLTDESIQD